jgi:hypothetical protein
MSGDKTKEILSFLTIWKTRKQVEDKFNLSNSESFHILRWLEKGKYITKKQLCLEKQTNRQWFYQSLNCEGKDD